MVKEADCYNKIMCFEDFNSIQYITFVNSYKSPMYVIPVDDIDTTQVINPIVNHGRWIIPCPKCRGGRAL